jgi:hypothetical protein
MPVPGDSLWTCPVGVTAVLVECWGSGGQGNIGQNFPNTGAGGGAGAYARKAGIPVTAGNTYLVRVGANSSIALNHNTLFINALTVNADFGQPGGFGSPGTGGKAASSTGDTKFDGGDGSYPGFILAPGGGGGGGGGRTGAGANGSGSTGGLGNDANNGGDGGAVNSPGHDGLSPGGGGGGGGAATGVQTAGGLGKDGALNIWDDTAGGGWVAVLAGTAPKLASFGNVPPDPIPPARPKQAAFFM